MSDCPLTRPSSSGPQPLSGRPCNPRVINEYSPSSRSRIVAGRGKLNPISSRDQIKVFTSVCHIVVSHVNFVVLQFNSTVYSGGLMTDLDCPWHFYMVFRTLTVSSAVSRDLHTSRSSWMIADCVLIVPHLSNWSLKLLRMNMMSDLIKDMS